MQTAVERRRACKRAAATAPHLNEIDFARLVIRSRIPGRNLLTAGAHKCHHVRHEFRIRDVDFVRADVEIRYRFRCKPLADNFVDELLQNLRALFALHAALKRALKRGAVPRHVNFGNQHHAERIAIRDELTDFLKRIKLSVVARVVLLVIELRIDAAFRAPALVFRQVPVENIDFVLGTKRDDFLQVRKRDVATSAVHHKAAHRIRRPVENFAMGNAARTRILNHLRERLTRIDFSGVGNTFDSYGRIIAFDKEDNKLYVALYNTLTTLIEHTNSIHSYKIYNTLKNTSTGEYTIEKFASATQWTAANLAIYDYKSTYSAFTMEFTIINHSMKLKMHISECVMKMIKKSVVII